MVSFELTEQQREIRQRARDFANEYIRPWATAADLEPEPGKAFNWEIIRKGSELGFRTMSVPTALGGGGVDVLTKCLIMEEFAFVDTGIAGAFDQCLAYSYILTDGMSDEQRGRWLPKFMDDPECLLAIGATEPGSGSDLFGLVYGPDIGMQLEAKRDGDEWVLNGMKQFISNGSIAKLYIILARTDNTVGIDEGVTGFIVEKGHPGFSFGKIYDKLGKRTEVNCELFFEDCRIPDRDRLTPVGDGLRTISLLAKGGPVETASLALGIARRAHEESLDWARSRVQGGKTIIEHQAVQLLLAEQAMLIEATRNFIWRTAARIDEGDPSATHFAMLCKPFAAEASFQCARLAMEVWGGRGYMKDYPIEKVMRDAAAYVHTGGMNNVQLMKAAQLFGTVTPQA